MTPYTESGRLLQLHDTTGHFRVTYEIVTPESAEDGDAAERGYMDRHGFHYTLDELGENDPPSMSLREAANLADVGEDCGRWWTAIDPIEDRKHFECGEDERRSIHPPDGITAASYRRVSRVFGVR